MRLICCIFCFALLGANALHAQDISPEQQNVLDQFGLFIDDHRGVEFVSDLGEAHVSYPSLKEAVEGFFTTQVKRDYTKISITDTIAEPLRASWFNRPLSIMDLVDLYLELN